METTNKFTLGILFFLLLFVIVLSVITMSVCFSIKDGIAVQAEQTSGGLPANADVDDKPSDAKTAIYVLCESEGIIAVKDANGEIVRTVNSYTAFMPEADREALKAGIPVYSEAELASLIEDLTK